MREFRQLQQYATTLSELMAEAQTLENQAAEAVDGSGAVRVVLDTSGLPETIWVAPDWDRDLEPDSIGTAVVEAAQSASARRMEAWAEALDEQGVTRRMDELGEVDDAPGAHLDRTATVDVQTPPRPVAPGVDRAGREVTPRPLEDLTEDVLAELDHAMASADPSPRPSVTTTGTDSTGQVSVTLAASGLVNCEVEAGWARGVDGGELTAALGEALRSARAQLSTAEHRPSSTSQLDQLLTEAFTILGNPRRFADS
jgi:DNA-binding protein YbaB